MRRLTVAVALIAALVWAATSTTASSQPEKHRKTCHETVQKFRPWSAKVWSTDRWRRKAPKDSTIAAYRHKLSCAVSPIHRGLMKGTWRSDKKAFYSHRSAKRWVAHYKPFVYPDGTRWAVPYPIAICESGENYYVGPSGAYGLIPPLPQYMPPKEQDEVAHRLYEEMGEGPWAPYEGGCYLR